MIDGRASTALTGSSVRRRVALSGLDHGPGDTPDLLGGLVEALAGNANGQTKAKTSGEGDGTPNAARAAAFDLLGTAAGSLALGVAAAPLDSAALSHPLLPSLGWAMAWLLVRPARRWPAIVAGTMLGELACSLLLGAEGWRHGPRVAAAVVTVVVAASLHRRWCGPGALLAGRRSMLALFVAVPASAAAGASVAALVALPDGYGAHLLWWWRSATLGPLVTVPLLVAASRWWRDGRRVTRVAEAAALSLALVAAAAAVFALGDLHVEYVLLPLMALCAVRFGMFGAAAGVAALTVATFAVEAPGDGTSFGHGFNEETVAQLYFIGAAMITLLLAAALNDHRRLMAQRDAATTRAAQEQRRLQALAEHAADVSVVVDRRGVVTYASPNVAHLLGRHTPHGGSSTSALHWVHPEDRADATAWLQAVLDGAAGASRRVELRLRRTDGTTVWVEAVASNWVDEPSVGGVVLNLRDMTTRRRSEDLNRALFEAMWEGALLLDARGVITRVDGSTGELLGCSPESLLGRRASELVPEAFRPEALGRMRDQGRILSRGPAKRSHQALPYDHPDGKVRWFCASASALREADGSVGGYAVLLSDLTDFHEAGRARRLAERRYRSIVESSCEGIVVTAADGRITFANGRAAILCGRSTVEELVGRPVGELFAREVIAAPYPDELRRRAGEAATWSRCRVRRADGALRWMHWTVSDMADDDDDPSCDPQPSEPQPSEPRPPVGPNRGRMLAGPETAGAAMHVFRDVTDQVELEGRRGSMAAELALAAEHERRRLAADLHDGPIQRLAATAIQLGSAAVQHQGQPALAKELLRAEELVSGTTTELRELLFQLAPPDLTNSGLAMAIGRAADLLLAPLGVNVEVRAELDEQPDAVVALAAYRIAQESLSNIRVHAGAEQVRLTVVDRGDGLLLEIRDDGIGCDAARLHTSRPGHLGIRSMRERAGDLGGWCRVDSAVGSGTTVTLWLPRQAARRPGAPAAQLSALPAERQS